MAARGARIARWLTDLALAAAGLVFILLLTLPLYPSLEKPLYLSGLILAALAPLLALASVVTGLAAGIGWPRRAAIALILGIVVSFWPLLWWLWFSNCPGYC